jgi:hypothetical protein
MATDANSSPTAMDARARQRARRREQAATAAARAGGMLSLAVVLLGAPAVVQHHNPTNGTATARASHAVTRAAADSAD